MLSICSAGFRRRRSFAATAAMAAVFLAAADAHAAFPALPAAPYDESGYWAVADRMQARLDATWDERAGVYRPGLGGAEPMVNASLLLTHAVAALRGHTGSARNDHRARLLAKRLVEAPPFVTRRPAGRPGSQVHAPGWVNSMTNANGNQHLVFDAEVVDGLVYAYRARAQLLLPDSTVQAIRAAVHGTARGSFWRWPTIRLNQINWYALMYAADATVTGDVTTLRHDFHHQLRRFLRGARGRTPRAGNFGPGMHFHYLPDGRPDQPANVDSAEYSNIVLSFTRFYEQARHAGMPALPRAHKRLIGQWIERAIAGYWTHAGYLNWDSGLGFERWHQAKKLGLAQQALVGIASTEALLPGGAWGRWAKYMLDRSFGFYDQLAVRAGGIPAGVLFDVTAVPQPIGSAILGAARVEANAARAIDAGLGAKAASMPPVLYAYDPDIGRLAVTAPTYNTAVIAVNQRAFPYGGLDLARLYDADQEVAANIGGTGTAAFGALVRDIGGHAIVASQVGRSSVSRAITPLRLLKAPRGAGVRASASAGTAYAGPFTDLRAAGTTSSGTMTVKVTHRFTPASIRTSWALRRRTGTARLSADVLFPSWGGPAARVTAVLRDGSRVAVGDTRLALAKVSWFFIHSERSGYVVVPASRRVGAAAHLLHPAPQSSQPKPGPTLAIQIARTSRFSRAGLSVRLVPARSEQEAARAASRLGAA